jgi:dimethylamine monooxygenase subunit C
MNLGAASSSKPAYAPLEWAVARQQILIADDAGAAAMKSLLLRPAPAGTEAVTLLCLGDPPAVSGLPLPERAGFPDEPGLAAGLRALLATSPMATRLYLAGSESFLAVMRRTAEENGLAHDAIQAEQRGSAARDAQCVHCKKIHRAVRHRAFDCTRCGVPLFVRDHYSRRLGAYQAVVIYPGDPNLALWRAEGFA